MAGFGADDLRWDGDMKPSTAGMPDMNGIQWRVKFGVQQLHTPGEIIKGMGWMPAIKFEVERSAIMCGISGLVGSVAEHGHKMGLKWQPYHKSRAIGDHVPGFCLGFMLPVAAILIHRKGFAKAAERGIVIRHGAVPSH